MQFVAVDVETANTDPGSVCQVGIAEFHDNELAGTWGTLIDPEDYFDAFNVSIHGIDEKVIEGAPTYAEVVTEVQQRLGADSIAVCHTHFDRTAFSRVHYRYTLPALQCTWLDSARVVRRAWPQFSRRGYRLDNVAQELGISFRHHDAVEDARVAGEILVRAIRETGLSVSDWLDRVEKPVHSDTTSVRRHGSGVGLLGGEVFAFTGGLVITRHEAANRVAELGAAVRPSVTKKTTVLVVGDQDVRRLAGYKKSSKHRKAEQLIAAGQSMRIVAEEGFLQLVADHRAS